MAQAANQWEYKVVYVDFRGRISSEGSEFIRQEGEHRTGFVRRYLDVLGAEGWELVAIQPLSAFGGRDFGHGFRHSGWGPMAMAFGGFPRSDTGYFIFRRPKPALSAAEGVVAA